MPRFTFGSGSLLSGIAFLPATIGLFAGAEIFKQCAREGLFCIRRQ
jgi:TctA family transporter